MAGSVKARKAAHHAVSTDGNRKTTWHPVTSSVMQFNYNNYCINILCPDTRI